MLALCTVCISQYGFRFEVLSTWNTKRNTFQSIFHLFVRTVWMREWAEDKEGKRENYNLSWNVCVRDMAIKYLWIRMCWHPKWVQLQSIVEYNWHRRKRHSHTHTKCLLNRCASSPKSHYAKRSGDERSKTDSFMFICMHYMFQCYRGPRLMLAAFKYLCNTCGRVPMLVVYINTWSKIYAKWPKSNDENWR